MAIGHNSSEKQVLGGLYTGLTNVKIVAINPNLEQLKGMGINAQKEPQYLSQTDPDKTTGATYPKMRLDFYLASTVPGVNLSKALKLSFWLEGRNRTNKDGNKVEWINKYGVTAWSSDVNAVPSYDWFSKEAARPTKVGEGDLVAFVKAWANVDPKDQATFDNIDNIIAGDITEILKLYELIKLNQVKVLLGVKDGKYQDVYSKYFERAYRNVFTGWKKALEGEYGEFKSDWQNELNFKAYTGSASVESDSPTTMGASSAQPTYTF